MRGKKGLNIMTRKDYIKLVKWIGENEITWGAIDKLMVILKEDNSNFCKGTFVDHIRYHKSLQIEESRKAATK